MRALTLLSAVSLTTLSGCVDMLGLGGLTYDEQPTPAATGGEPGADGGGSGGEVEVTSAGTGGVTPSMGGAPYIDMDFPRQLGRDALFAVAPNDSSGHRYWIYEPSDDALSAFSFRWGAPDWQGVQPWFAREYFTRLTAVPVDSGITLVGYNQTSGYVSMVTDADGEGELTVLSDDYGTSGRTELIAAFSDDEWFALTYSSGTGDYRYFRPLPSDEPAVFSGTWEAGYAALATYVHQGEPGVLKLDPSGGRLIFDRFVEYGEPYETVFEVSVQADLMVPFFSGAAWKVLLYEKGSGEVKVVQLASVEEDVIMKELQESYFRGDLSAMHLIWEDSEPSVITFSDLSGTAVVRNLIDLEEGSVIVVR